MIAHIRKEDKAIESLFQHLEEVANKTGEYTDKIDLKEMGQLAGWLHDIGKATESFQQYILFENGMLENSNYISNNMRDHATAGGQYIDTSLEYKTNKNQLLEKIIAITVLSHHTGLINSFDDNGKSKTNYETRMKKDVQLDKIKENLDKKIRQQIDILIQKNKTNNKLDSVRLKINQLDSGNISLIFFQLGLLTKFVFSSLCDADRLCTACFMNPIQEQLRNKTNANWDKFSERLERELNKFTKDNNINVIRQEISNTCISFSSRKKGCILQLNVPTGGGKTLSSLRFAINHARANDMDKIIYVVPYTSIIEQNAKDIRNILEENEREQIVLECHSNLTAKQETEKSKLLSENWDSPIVLTTMVQFLESIYGGLIRYTRRMHTMANAVLIFDEIQTLPIKHIHLFNEFIRFITEIGSSTVLLCTATQPLLDYLPLVKDGQDRSLKIIEENKIIKKTQELNEQLKRVNVIDKTKKEGWENSELVDFALDCIENSDSLLIIVNKKQDAKDLYDELKLNRQIKVIYLSTNMCAKHRSDKIEEIKKILDNPNSTKIICVSTQLIEAGVNIDFQVVIRFLAGLDSIAQAAGRCNRHGKMKELGNVFIINKRNENLKFLPDIRDRQPITMRLLNEFKQNPTQFDNDLIGSKAIKRYFKYLYAEYQSKDNRTMEYIIPEINDTIYGLLSKNEKTVTEGIRNKTITKKTNVSLVQSFQTASEYFKSIEATTRGVIVPYGEGKEIIEQLCIEKNPQLISLHLKRAQRYSINLYSYQFQSLYDEGVVYEIQQELDIYYLDKSYYDEQCGLINGINQTLIV